MVNIKQIQREYQIRRIQEEGNFVENENINSKGHGNMTIRTPEEFEKLNSEMKKYSDYLPIEFAYKLKELAEILKLNFQTNDDRLKSIEKINTWLTNNNYVCEGYFNKTLHTSKHKCEACFFENVRTNYEASKNISGKDSIGVHFIDSDDKYNDWIFVAWDLLTPVNNESNQNDESGEDEISEVLSVGKCPFCGNDDTVFNHKEDDYGTQFWRITCNSCGGEGGDAITKEEAVQKWNMRTGIRITGISSIDSDLDGNKFAVWMNYRSNIIGKFKWKQDADMFKKYLDDMYKKDSQKDGNNE